MYLMSKEDFMQKYGLLEEFENTKPKREKKDDVNGYFSKVVNHEIEYINKLNEKMK